MNTYNPSASVNTNQLNLLRSHCFDEFSMPNSSWGRTTAWRYNTAHEPSEYNENAGLGAFFLSPLHLVQRYCICYNKLTISPPIAFGSTAGSACIATSITVTFMIMLIGSSHPSPATSTQPGRPLRCFVGVQKLALMRLKYYMPLLPHHTLLVCKHLSLIPVSNALSENIF